MVGKKITFDRIKECDCGNEAAFFHSKCCMAHFEGVVKDGRLFIACERCGKMAGELK